MLQKVKRNAVAGLGVHLVGPDEFRRAEIGKLALSWQLAGSIGITHQLSFSLSTIKHWILTLKNLQRARRVTEEFTDLLSL